MKNKNIKKEWWETTFNEKYTTTYVDAAPFELTIKQVDFLHKNLKLKKGAKILDLACGFGRHSIELAKKGYNVTGVDFSNYLIKLARDEAKKQNINVTFIKKDIRKIYFKGKFDAAINMFTSFGYFKNEEDHALAIKNFSQSLKVKGKLLIDLNNSIYTILSIFKKSNKEKETKLLTNTHKKKLSNGLVLTTVNQFDHKTMRWNMKRSWEKMGKRESYYTSVRLFFLPEINNLMENNGLRIKKTWGDFDGRPFNFNSHRLIILAEKFEN